MSFLLYKIPGNEHLWNHLLRSKHFTAGEADFRHFPDGESFVRIHDEVKGKKVGLLCTLNNPDTKLMMLYLFSSKAHQMGAESVVLISPYLAYMRQDIAFHPGEAISSDLFAALVSQWFDTLITVDPHLHRHKQLSEIYSIPTYTLHAGPLIVKYLNAHIKNPVIIGPDEESKQWVFSIASDAECPFLVLTKERMGDRKVKVSVPEIKKIRGHTPVLIDDIISTGQTMIEASKHLQANDLPAPVCIGIHGIFSGNAWQALQAGGIEHILTSNTIYHPTNALDVSDMLHQIILDQLL